MYVIDNDMFSQSKFLTSHVAIQCIIYNNHTSDFQGKSTTHIFVYIYLCIHTYIYYTMHIYRN